MLQPPKHLREILWEYDIEAIESNHPVVLERVLLLGEPEDIRYIGLPVLRQYFEAKPTLPDIKSQRFWEQIFGLPPNNSSRSLYDQINSPQVLRDFR